MLGDRFFKMPDNASKLVDDIRQKGVISGILSGAQRFSQENADARKRLRTEGLGLRKR